MVAGPLVSHLRAAARILGKRALGAWRRYRALRPRSQAVIALALVALLVALLMLLGGGKSEEAAAQLRTVTLAPVGELSGGGAAGSVIGTVRSITEAEILAESAGTVRVVNARVGATVPAGFVLAELENAAERAAVLQAEGAYDAAVAARAAVSPSDVRVTARNAYRDAFVSLETALENQIDLFYGEITPAGPDLQIAPPGSDPYELSRERAAVERLMDEWRRELPSADSRDPEALIDDAEAVARAVESLAGRLADAANRTGSNATAAQTAALAAARASVSGTLSSLTGARAAYRSGATSSTSSVDAGVKSALGNLRLAQASLERTVIRAPIGGTVNFLPVRVGGFVTALQHVATVAQNGALEVVAYVSEDERARLAVGTKVAVDAESEGVVTVISPALDPVTRQIEVRIAVAGSASALVNGQSVRIGIPGAPVEASAALGPALLPLSAVKLRADDRIVFSVGEDGRLVAHHVEIGEVRGDRLEILSPLPFDLRIVTDARGLSEGDAVNVAAE